MKRYLLIAFLIGAAFASFLLLSQPAKAFPHCSVDQDPINNPSGLPKGSNGKCSDGSTPIELAGSPQPTTTNDQGQGEGDIRTRQEVTCDSFAPGGKTDPRQAQGTSDPIAVGDYGWDAICDSSQPNIVMGLVVGISNWVVVLIGAIIVLMIIVGGVQMVASAGSPDGVKAARTRIVNALMSLVVLISMRAILALVSIGAGQQEFFGVTIPGAGEKLDSVPALILAITNFTLFLGGGLSVIFIIVGALRYIASGGNQTNLQKAKNTIMYAVFGLIISISAVAIVSFILNNLK